MLYTFDITLYINYISLKLQNVFIKINNHLKVCTMPFSLQCALYLLITLSVAQKHVEVYCVLSSGAHTLTREDSLKETSCGK